MSESLKKGLTKQEPISQKQPRSEVKGSQKPVIKKESVKSDRGTFSIK